MPIASSAESVGLALCGSSAIQILVSQGGADIALYVSEPIVLLRPAHPQRQSSGWFGFRGHRACETARGDSDADIKGNVRAAHAARWGSVMSICRNRIVGKKTRVTKSVKWLRATSL